jgi:hypothetical protein
MRCKDVALTGVTNGCQTLFLPCLPFFQAFFGVAAPQVGRGRHACAMETRTRTGVEGGGAAAARARSYGPSGKKSRWEKAQHLPSRDCSTDE